MAQCPRRKGGCRIPRGQNFSGAMVTTGGGSTFNMSSHVVTPHLGGAHLTSGTLSYSLPFIPSDSRPMKCAESVPILVPSSTWTFEDTIDDISSTPSERIPLLTCSVPPLSNSLPSHMTAYDVRSTPHIMYILTPSPPSISDAQHPTYFSYVAHGLTY